MNIPKNLTGQKFGKLTVIKRVENYVRPSGKTSSQWLCKCDCGNEVVVLYSSLTNKKTQSCGCLQKEETSKRYKKYNTYDLFDDYGIGYTSKGEEFYFDLEDYDKIKDYCWYVNAYGYIASHSFGECNRKAIMMHRLLLPNSKIIDHINHNKRDNRKSNLRITTSSQNNMNKKISSNNTSGATGVYWYKRSNKWAAIIKVNGKQKYLGTFVNFEDAVKARKDAEEKYFGEYSYNNSINKGNKNGECKNIS